MKNENPTVQMSALLQDVRSKIVVIREQNVIVDADVARLYGVETRRINEAVRNNPEKFPETYMFQLDATETEILRSKFSTANVSSKSRVLPKVFTEKGLYMLATILKSKTAVNTTFAIIETFAMVRTLKKELVELHQEPDKKKQMSIMNRFGDVLSEVVMPDLETTETESSLELNFLIGKLTHTVKRVKKNS
ncbi:ORF6N domain-containing protein [Fibrobacter sp.]|uniref:ORF6N domain-containing protein n=1 Tax=Fibrobacter sp. TaxID=35828 RepID=UPI00386FAC98